MMDVFIKEFPKQLKVSMEIGAAAKLTKHDKVIQNITVLGMGGSGIGGNFVTEFVSAFCKVPMLSCKGYDLPSYIGPNSLVIASSFSGNTEETLIAFEQAIKTGAKIVCVSSGGRLKERAEAYGLDYIQLPAVDQPPRTCLGYSFVQQLYILKFFGFAEKKHLSDLKLSITLLENHQEKIKRSAVAMAQKIHKKFPIIYATERMSAVALRLRQQMNENSKLIALNHTIPEQNHNELVGWRAQESNFSVIIFRTKDDHERNSLRINVSKTIIEKQAEILEIDCLGDSLIEQAMYAVHFGDWISWELANLRKVDSIEVNVIDQLKSALAAAVLG